MAIEETQIQPQEETPEYEGQEEEMWEGEDEAEIEEEVSPGEEVGTEAETEETEEEPDIPIVYRADNGETVEKNIPYSQLANMVKDYERLNQDVGKYNEYFSAVNPIIQTVQNSELLQSILYYKAQGYSEEQIRTGLMKLWESSQATTPEKQYESYEEELKDKLMKEIEMRLKPIESQANQIVLDKHIADTIRHNDQVLQETIAELGIEPPKGEQIVAMSKYLADMFPGQDFRLLRLNKTIAKALLQLVADKPAKVPAKVAAKISKTSHLPQIIKTQGIKQQPQSNLRGHAAPPKSLEERIRLKKELFK